MSSCIFCSVVKSMLAVASSRITTLFFLRTALQMHKRDFSPDERFSPPSWIYRLRRSEMLCSSVSESCLFLLFWEEELLFDSLFVKWSKPAFLRSSRISSSVALSYGSILNLKVPVNRVGSWGIIVIFSLSCSKEWSAMLFPSMRILPSSISTILVNARLIVLLPAPVLPTIPIFCPPLMLRLRPFKTFSVFGLYLKTTSWNSIFP